MDKYNIGLDLRTDGVGWSVTDPAGRLIRRNGKHLFGTVVFEEAASAKERRRYRAQRRQRDRAKVRIDALQNLMAPDVLAEDNAFYIRLDDTSSDREDRAAKNLYSTLPDNLFEDGSKLVFNKQNGRKSLPIYEIREELATQHKKADARYVYLAIAHILKHRGYFTETDRLDEESLRAEAAMHLDQYIRYINDQFFMNIYLDPSGENLLNYLDMLVSEDPGKEDRLNGIIQQDFSAGVKGEAVMKAVTKLLQGRTVDLSEIFSQKRKRGLISFATLRSIDVYDRLSDEAADAVQHLEAVYEWAHGVDLRTHTKHELISTEMSRRYNLHREDLQELKAWFRKYMDAEAYRAFFHTDNDDSNYNAYSKSRTGDTCETDKWNHCSQEKFYARLKQIFMSVKGEGRAAAKSMLDRMYNAEDGEVIPNGFLPLQRISANSQITNLQQVNELKKIIENQSEYHRSIRENADKIISLCTFRIPYYVGPLKQDEKSPFEPWIRYKNNENERIMPWNLSDRVDLAATAEGWIDRATNKCTYLAGEKALPKHSLAYEEYMLLNELNSLRIMYDDPDREVTEQHSLAGTGVDSVTENAPKKDNKKTLSPEIKDKLIREVFSKQKKNSIVYLCRWLQQNAYHSKRNIRIVTRDGVPVEKINASLSAWVDMEKILGHDAVEKHRIALEKVIKWSTLYTERSIYVQRLHEEMKEEFTPEQLKRMEGLRYSGWGRYSYALLCDPLCNYKGREVSVLEVMRHVSQDFMKIYHAREYGFKEKIAERNRRNLDENIEYDDVAGLVTSPAMRRTIWTAVRVINEITHYMKGHPDHIFLRNMRENNAKKKLLADKNITRYDHLRAYYDAYEKTTGSKIDPDIKATLQSMKGKDMGDTEYLYLLQLGRCMYSGEKIDLRSPSTYIMDYAVPLYLTSDDTLMNNRVLVKKNKRLNGMPLSKYTIRNMRPFWETLLGIGMVTRQKFNGLIIEEYTEETYQFFLKNQITENNLLIERMTWLLRNAFPNSIAYGINSRLTDLMRKANDAPRIRDLNDMQQAYDAFLAAHAGAFVARYMPELMNNGGVEQIRLKKLEKAGMGDKNGAFMAAYKKTQDDETAGESTWTGEKERYKYLRSAYSWHDGFVTRRVKEYTGKFYFETLFRPTPGKEDPFLVSKKGSHKQAYVAYMDVIQYTDKHDAVWKELVSIPAYIAAKNSPSMEMSYIENALGFDEKKGIGNLALLRRKVLLNQETVIAGHPYYLRTAGEWINAKQLYVRPEYIKYVYMSLAMRDPAKEYGRNDPDDEYMFREAARYLLDKLASQYKIYGKLNKSLEENKDKLLGMPVTDVMLLIRAMVYSMGTRSERAQPTLKKIKGLQVEGENRLVNKRLRAEAITLVHRSITGLYSVKEVY